MPIAGLICLGSGVVGMNVAYCLKGHGKKQEAKTEKTFTPFADPSGIPYEEYKQMETTNNIQHNEAKYNKLKTAKTSFNNIYNSTDELQK